jgi:hypothetical protein
MDGGALRNYPTVANRIGAFMSRQSWTTARPYSAPIHHGIDSSVKSA